VPNHQFLPSLSLARFFDRLRLHPVAESYRAFFNRISRHYHSDPPEVWEKRLAEAGFELQRWWHYYPPASQAATEWGHYFGLPSLVCHKLTGRWILAPTRWNLGLTERLVRKYVDNSATPEGVYTLYVARRKECPGIITA
jgi:hypothetical protein